MKKLKLLIAVVAILFGGVPANAQASYNTSWTEGVEVTTGYDYFLYNIGSGTFLTGGMDWGSSASGDHAGKTVEFRSAGEGVYNIWSYYYSPNGLSNDGFLGINGYLDAGESKIANCVFTTVSVDGYINAYTIKNTTPDDDQDKSYNKFLRYNADDTRVRWSDNGADNYAYWLIIPKASRDAIGDYTYYIQNVGMNRFWERACWSGSTWNNTGFATGGRAANPCSEKYHGAFDFYQTLSRDGLQAGRYRLYAQAFWNQDGSSAGPVLYINDETQLLAVFNANGEGTADNMNGASDAFTAGQYVNSVEKFFSSAPDAGNVKLGINISANDQWVIWDNFYFQYLGQVVLDYAEELPTSGEMEANKWYYFDIAAAADNYEATATDLDKIICVTDEYTLTSATSGTVALKAEDNSLTPGRYYVKSSTANKLVVEVPSFSYNVSQATANIAYIQPGHTVTVSYTVSTNDPAATISMEFSGVTFNGASVTWTPTENGFSFIVPEGLAAGTTYKLIIPANAVGYAAGNTYTAKQEITFTTPAILDGVYFLKVANETAAKGKYLARGMNYGTHATLDKYGLPIQIATDGSNITTLQAYDTKRYFFHANSYDCYADQASLAESGKFTVTLTDGKYRIHNNTMGEGLYLKYTDSDVNDANIRVYDDGTGSNAGPIIDWTLETGAEHAMAMQALKDGQATTAAAAAFASGNYASLEGITTVAALEAELTANYIQGDFVTPSAIESISEKYQGGQPGSGNITETVYSNTIHISEPGFYKFSMQAFYRAGSNDVTQAMHTAGVDFPPVVLFFGDSETQIKSVYDDGGLDQGIAEGYYEQETVGGNPVQYNGKWYTNGQHNSVIIFQKDYYHNDVWFYASEPGTYSYGVKYLGYANANMQWFIYSPESVTITSYAAAADATDYANLATAIAAYDDAAWGFEKDEYAPYNNAEARANIAAAKAIDTGATNSKLLVNSLIADIALNANTEELNAFYDGDFSECAEDNASPLDYTPAGWTASENFRMMLKNAETYPGLADASIPSAVFTWSGGITYGETVGYEMPLKANTTYVLKLKAAGWENQTRSGITVSVLNAEDGLAATDLGTPDRDIKGNEQNTAGMTSFVKYFKTGAAGNYVFHVQSGNNIVLTDFDLRRPSNVYAVVGGKKKNDESDPDDKAIFSGYWDQATQTDYMEETSAGVYTKTYSDLTLDKQTIEYKVMKKNRVEATTASSDADWYPASNKQISIPVKGIYDITFTFTESGTTVIDVVTKTAEAVTIGEKKWATTVTNSALDFSASEVEAYTATVNDAKTTVALEKVDDVQAETGLVLKGAEGTYYIPVTASSETPKGSLLSSSTDSYWTWHDNGGENNTFYGLSVNGANEAQFVKIACSAGNEVEIPAGKAFLLINSANAARELKVVFANEANGIDAIVAEKSVEGIYNMNGQRVAAPAKGLYIVNGKKVIMK